MGYNKYLEVEYSNRLEIILKLKQIEINGDYTNGNNIFTQKEIYSRALNFIDNRIKLLLEKKEKARLKQKEKYQLKKSIKN